MKASDIDDDVFLKAVRETPHRPGTFWRMRHDVQATLEYALEVKLPEKLFLAKARKLGKKRKLEGCTDCSCRGDYHLPIECFLRGCCYGSDKDWASDPRWDDTWIASWVEV